MTDSKYHKLLLTRMLREWRERYKATDDILIKSNATVLSVVGYLCSHFRSQPAEPASQLGNSVALAVLLIYFLATPPRPGTRALEVRSTARIRTGFARAAMLRARAIRGIRGARRNLSPAISTKMRVLGMAGRTDAQHLRVRNNQCTERVPLSGSTLARWDTFRKKS